MTGGLRPRPSGIQEAAQLAAVAGVLELAQGLGLDLLPAASLFALLMSADYL